MVGCDKGFQIWYQNYDLIYWKTVEKICNYIDFGCIFTWYKSKQETQIEKNVTFFPLLNENYFLKSYSNKRKTSNLHQFSILPDHSLSQDCVFGPMELKEWCMMGRVVSPASDHTAMLSFAKICSFRREYFCNAWTQTQVLSWSGLFSQLHPYPTLAHGKHLLFPHAKGQKNWASSIFHRSS